MSSTRDQKSDGAHDVVCSDSQQAARKPSAGRPPLEYTSLSSFVRSLRQRIAHVVCSRRFVTALLSGQLLALCITCSDVSTTTLVRRGWALPATQSFFLYFTLAAVYTPWTQYRYGIQGWFWVVLRDGWKYFILAACDVEGNFLVVTAYQYTDLLSCMLLNAWAIPVCMFVSWFYMRTRYHWTQLLGVVVCIGGLALLVASDRLTGKDLRPVSARGKGDALMLAGATLYGFANATEEFLVRKRPLYEVVGQIGFWGAIICGVQATKLENKRLGDAVWDSVNVGLLSAYTTALFILYSVAPLLFRLTSSTYFNLSLLSSDFYGLIFGICLFQLSPFWLYFVAFAVVLLGLVVYYWHAMPEEQGSVVDPQPPTYLNSPDGNNVNKAEVSV